MPKIQPLHGRTNPDQDMNEMGYSGPVIRDVKAIHATYQTHFNVYFRSAEAAQAAQVLTGWEWWDTNALEMRFLDDLLIVDGEYYGDWEIQEDNF
jgi:hypothetical protein